MMEIVMTVLLLVSAYFAYTSSMTWIAVLFIVLSLTYVASFVRGWNNAKREMEQRIQQQREEKRKK